MKHRAVSLEEIIKIARRVLTAGRMEIVMSASIPPKKMCAPSMS
jgi:hypothetical protein